MANDFIFSILLLRPEWPHAKMTDGPSNLFPVIHPNLSAGAFEAMNDHADTNVRCGARRIEKAQKLLNLFQAGMQAATLTIPPRSAKPQGRCTSALAEA
jgi:hypothetical protein